MRTSSAGGTGIVAAPTTRPPRMTVTSPQSSSTSSSLCETKMTLMPSRGERAQRVEEQLALVGGDARRRLVEDEHPRAQPEQAGDLELLALADRERARRRVEVEGEAEAVARAR